MRKQYDEIHISCKRTEEEFQRVREQIRQLDNFNRNRLEEKEMADKKSIDLNDQLTGTSQQINEAKLNGKVYAHMLERIRKEQSVLRQKVLEMEAELNAKKTELKDKQRSFNKAKDTNVSLKAQVDQLREELERDRAHHQQQLQELEMTIDAKNSAVQRRKDFDAWRQEIAKGAAADAFHACAGKLQKAYAIERMISASLARTLFAKVQIAQPTEEAFQRIRGVTGNCRLEDENPNETGRKSQRGSPSRSPSSSPTRPAQSPTRTPARNTVNRIAQQQGGNASPAEVTAIVNRFVSREADQQKLREDVKVAESDVEKLRKEYNELREKTSNIVDDEGTRMRALYNIVGEHESELAKLIKQHTEVRERAHAAVVQLERTRKWARELHLFFRNAGWDETDHDLEEESSLIEYIRGPLKNHLLKISELARKTKDNNVPVPPLEEREVELEVKLLHDPIFRDANTRVNMLSTPAVSDFLPLPPVSEDEGQHARFGGPTGGPAAGGSDRSLESDDDEAYLRDRRHENKQISTLLVQDREQDKKKKRRSPSRKNPASPQKSAPASPSKF
eukprot:GDKJ01028950.1.p1 GENE.GDKJ01028950.1~~GDKJ01028950.1.p1  ORF type:complete len:593 (+),score=163.32 GDKJ01028950.1:91-1779(+)